LARKYLVPIAAVYHCHTLLTSTDCCFGRSCFTVETACWVCQLQYMAL